MRLLILAAILATAFVGLTAGAVSADGNGSPDDCKTDFGATGDPVASYDAGDGNIVDGVCIKSGSNMFDGNQHSDVLGNGVYEDGCYEVSGVGTQVATVTRLEDGSDCQAISHIDLILATCGDECEPPCTENCEPCTKDCDPCTDDCQDPCDADDPPAECDPYIEVCFEGEIIEVPESQAPDDTGDCDLVRVCVDGDFVTVQSGTVGTHDCGFINVCIGGEVERISEYDAEQAGIEEGQCEREDPPVDPTPPTQPQPIEEVEEVVASVMPVEEVAALPAAGYGATESGLGWTALAALGLIGIGGGLILITRHS
jgi:hypothetical protein